MLDAWRPRGRMEIDIASLVQNDSICENENSKQKKQINPNCASKNMQSFSLLLNDSLQVEFSSPHLSVFAIWTLNGSAIRQATQL